MLEKQNKPIELQNIRERILKNMATSENQTKFAKENANNLFALDLTVYSRIYTFDSCLYSAFATSNLNEELILHPEQLQIINKIKECEGLIVSAPTSFGKTFCIFEYISIAKPRTVVLIVPTLALVDEYKRKIINAYKNRFIDYKVFTNIDIDKNYEQFNYKLFILTHDKVVQMDIESIITSIDFLVVDEVYRLETDESNDRVLIFNMAYFNLAKISKKYVLLAPFINDIIDIDKLDKKPCFYKTNYSPVINEVKIKEIINESDRFVVCDDLLTNKLFGEKNLIYFPSVTDIYKYVRQIVGNKPIIDDLPQFIVDFIKWGKEEIHKNWGLLIALERGYLIHNGQLPIGTRLFQMDSFEKNEQFNNLLCTSTLLEGINCCAKNLIIIKPSRKIDREVEINFTTFDFFNLVGRTGRLYKHIIGTAYYIKTPNDPTYSISEAIKDIRFEITAKTDDIKIQQGDINDNEVFKNFLLSLNITYEEYISQIKSKYRFGTIYYLFNSYLQNKINLIQELKLLSEDDTKGRFNLINILYGIIEGSPHNLYSMMINNIINKNRYKISTIIEKCSGNNANNIDFIISKIISLKMSYIEHVYYPKVQIIKYFMEKEGVPNKYLETIHNRILSSIESIYFMNSAAKKTLIDFGIYERDVNEIIKIIGSDFVDVNDMKNRLNKNKDKFIKISYISKYIIDNYIGN